jgi:hypothetical protein
MEIHKKKLFLNKKFNFFKNTLKIQKQNISPVVS